MRITGGTARGRRLNTPKTSGIRPTSDRVREALFSILGPRVAGSRVLDLFAGTGSLGIEALSRGAASALFVDQSLEAGRLIESNLRSCLARPQAAFVQRNLAAGGLLRLPTGAATSAADFDLIFMDPPYGRNLAMTALVAIAAAGLLAVDGLVVAEEERRAELAVEIGDLTLIDQRRYGETGLWFYTRHPALNQTRI